MNPLEQIVQIPEGKYIRCTIADGKLQLLQHWWPWSTCFCRGTTSIELTVDNHPESIRLANQVRTYADKKQILLQELGEDGAVV